MKNYRFPRSRYELERLCEEHFMDIVHGSNEHLPDLIVQYKTLDGRYGGAPFGQFFFFGDCMYLLRSMEEPDDDSNLDVFCTVFEKYYAPEYNLAWNDCKRVEFDFIETKENYDVLTGVNVVSPDDTCLFNYDACKNAFDCGEFGYYVRAVCRRSLPLVRKALKDDLFETFFDFLKSAKAFSETWMQMYNSLRNSDPFPMPEEFDTSKMNLVSSFLMPFETEPLVLLDEPYDFFEIEKIIGRLNDIPKLFGWKIVDKYIEREKSKVLDNQK